MTEPRFFKPSSSLTIAEIASLTGAAATTGASLDRIITGVATLDRAGPSDITYFDNARYAQQLTSTQAGACLIPERFERQAPTHLVTLRTQEPYRAFVAVARKLFPESLRPSSVFEAEGVAPGAYVHTSAQIGEGVIVDPGAVIGPRAEIGAGTVIGATVVIGADVRIGRDCSVGPGATIVHSLIGDNVIVHAGCHIGQDGFRFLAGPTGHAKVPQLGRVIIHDHVEIGAGTTIDRGGTGDTVIGAGTKIDNLVQIGHNVTIGRHCIIVAQCGLSGSVVLDDQVVLGGQVGIADHLTIGKGAVVGAKSGVATNIPPGERWLGAPAWPGIEFLRANAVLRKYAGQGKKLEK